MIKIFTFCFLLLFSKSILSQTPELEWAGTMKSVSYDFSPFITTTPDDDLIYTKRLDNLLNIDVNGNNSVETPFGSTDLVISKVNSDGIEVWTQIIHSDIMNEGFVSGIPTTADNGDIFIYGLFNGSIDFDPSMSGTHILSCDENDLFILKLVENGDFIDVLQIESGGITEISDLVIDETDNSLVACGFFQDTLSFETSSGSTDSLISLGYIDGFILKLNQNLEVEWDYHLGEVGYQGVANVDIDLNGDYYFTGAFHDTVDFDPGPGIHELNSFQDNDLFILKLNSNGDFQFAEQSQAQSAFGYSTGFNIKIAQNNDIIVLGAFAGNVNFDLYHPYFLTAVPGTPYSDIVIARYNNTGQLIWAKQIGGYYTDYAISLEIDSQEGILFSGYYAPSADLDPNPADTLTGTHQGFENIFIERLFSNGELDWVLEMGNSNYSRAQYLSLTSSDKFYVSGSYYDTIDIDPGLNELLLTPYNSSSNTNESFIAKFSQLYLGIQTNEATSFFNVYPNPASNYSEIINQERDPHTVMYKLYTTTGEIVKEGRLDNPRIDVSDLPNGLYMLSANVNGIIKTSKIIVKH